MAIYHLSVKPVSRSSGRTATASAAYRAGCEITDERTGQIHDYTRKSGVESADIVLPDGAPDWALDRSKLWNAAELAENRKDACVAREFEVALPSELSATERRRLALDFAKDMANREGCGVDVAIHAPGKEGDNRNHHAHILRTTRKVEADGLGAKLDTEKAGRKRSEDLDAVRARWAAMTNERLRENGIAARVDHRSLEAQGIEREPTQHLGVAATGIERRTDAPSRKRLDWERDNAERLARTTALGELEREQESESDRSIIDLSGDLAAAKRELLAQQDRARQEAEQIAEQQAKKQAQEQAKEIERKAQQERQEQQQKRARELEKEEMERQRIDAMSSEQIRAEIRKIAPPSVQSLIERDPEWIAAHRQDQALTQQYKKEQAREATAQREAEHWRQEHPLRAKLHDMGMTTASFLTEKKQIEDDARTAWQSAATQGEDASLTLRHVHSAIEMRVIIETTPQRARVNELEAIARRKQEAEQIKKRQAQERTELSKDFTNMATNRAMQVSGYRDSSDDWQATPEPLRKLIDLYNKGTESMKVTMLKQLIEDPNAAGHLYQMISQREEKVRQSDRGMSP